MRLRRSRTRRVKPANSQRWIVSYADFITLLFAFFLIMYSVSSLNESKYRKMATYIDASFSSIARSLLPLEIRSELSSYAPSPEYEFTPELATMTSFQELAHEIKKSLSGLIDEQKVLVHESERWIEIELKADLLFRSGSAQLMPQAEEYLKPIAAFLKSYPNPIQVEGFTDSVPIENPLYPSNWELSSSRASSVVRELIEMGLDRTRMVAIGYGSNYPLMDNATEEGRKANRRVVLLVANQDTRTRLTHLQDNQRSRLEVPIRSGGGQASQTYQGQPSLSPLTDDQIKLLEQIKVNDDGAVRYTILPREDSQQNQSE